MNIKEAIERGLYPKDEKGNSLVPHSEGGHITVFSTSGLGDFPIIGWNYKQAPNPNAWLANATCLLPPPPRKVKVKAYAVIVSGHVPEVHANRSEAERHCGFKDQIVELTGEYEEPWS